MKTISKICGIALALTCGLAAFSSGAQTIQNPSFESPSVYNSGNNYYSFSFDPGGADWTFSGLDAGIAANGSGYVFFSPPDPVPDGSQCAFLQSVSGSSASVSQTINFPSANDFIFTFYSSQRDIDTRDNTANQTITVQVDGATVLSAVPQVGWTMYYTPAIYLTAGNHTLAFSCAEVPGNATVLVDEVNIIPALTWVTNNNTITITGYYVNSGGVLAIPDTIGGFPVTSIATGAFVNDTLNGMTISTNVTSIGAGAFYECPDLASVTIPGSVTSIGENAFYGCSSLTSVTIPGGITYLQPGIFGGCTSLGSVTIPNGVTGIGNGAFDGCSDLGSVTIPNSVTDIGPFAFYGCTSLTSVTIPGSVTGIGDQAFADCSSLAAVYFEGNAPSVIADQETFYKSPVTVYYLPWTAGWPTFASATGVTPQVWPAGVQISATPINAPVGLAIHFTCPDIDLYGNTITNWNWNFGDGATSTNQNPSHAYATAGSYTPYLLAGNDAGTIDPGYGLSITVSPPPVLGGVSVSGTNLVITGANGCAGLTYYVLSTTNLLLPISQWTPIATNTWSANGNFSVTLTNVVNPSMPQCFYLLAATVNAQNSYALYVVNSGNNTIGEYGLDGSIINASLISSGLNLPETIAFSGNDLFVVNGNTVGEYTTSGKTVNASLISGLNEPASGAISGTNLFIMDQGGNFVGEYSTSGATVNASLITGLDGDYGIAISGTNMFITDFNDGTVGEYSTSGATVNASLITGLYYPVGITIAGTNLFVASLYGGTIGEYTTSGATVNASLISGLDQPQRIAILGTNLFVACEASGTIGEYTTSGATVNASLITGLSNPLDVELGPAP